MLSTRPRSIGLLLTLAVSLLLFSTGTAQEPAPQIIRKSGGVLQQSATNRKEPAYPPLAKAARVSGSVVVEVTLDEQGTVIAARPISGHPLLKDAAVAAAREWTFKPTQLSGVPVKVIGTLTFNFNLDKEPAGGDAGLQEAKQAVAANPNSPDAHIKLGRAYAEDDRLEDAVKEYREALWLKPDQREAYIALGSVYRDMNRPDDEIAAYKEALTHFSRSSEFLERLVQVLVREKRYAEAVDTEKQIVELNPDDADKLNSLGWYNLQLARFDEAIAALKKAVTLRPNFALAYHNIGWANARREHYEEALAAYSQAVTVQPGYPQAYRVYNEMAGIYARLNRYDDAEAALKHSLEIRPGNPEAFRMTGTLYHETARYELAVEPLSKAIAMAPSDPYLRYSLGDIYGHLGRFSDAEAAFREAVKQKADFGQAYLGLSASLHIQQKSDEADALLRQAAPLIPVNVNVRVLRASMLDHLDRKSEAAAELRLILKTDSNNPLALNNLGYIMVEQNEKVDEALQMIQRAVNADPKNGAYLDSLGWAYFKLGKLDEAERYLTEAVKARPESSTIQEHLGDLYQRQNKLDQARAQWEKALALPNGAGQAARIKVKLNPGAKK